jgi:hypothetical protein
MKSPAVRCLMLMLLAVPVFCQDSVRIDRYYLGGLFVGTYDRNATLLSDVSVRGAVEAKTLMLGGTFTGRLIYTQPGESGAQFWMTQGDLAVGYMPRPVSDSKPSPVSDVAHFIPPALTLIPGAATGIAYTFFRDTEAVHEADGCATFVIDATGRAVLDTCVVSLRAGVYRSEVSRSAEFDAGVIIGNSDRIVRFGFYASEKELGVVASAEVYRYGKLAVLHTDSAEVAFFGTYKGPNGVEPFASITYRDFQVAPEWVVGATKVYAVQGGANVLVGLGYTSKKFMEVYLQVFFM